MNMMYSTNMCSKTGGIRVILTCLSLDPVFWTVWGHRGLWGIHMETEIWFPDIYMDLIYKHGERTKESLLRVIVILKVNLIISPSDKLLLPLIFTTLKLSWWFTFQQRRRGANELRGVHFTPNIHDNNKDSVKDKLWCSDLVYTFMINTL